MRTTLTVDDQVLAALKEAAHRSGKPFRQVVNDALHAGLQELAQPSPHPYRLQPADMGPVRGRLRTHKRLHVFHRLCTIIKNIDAYPIGRIPSCKA